MRKIKFSKRIADTQAALPFSGDAHGLFAYALPWERRLFASLSVFIMILIGLYVYFIMASVFHAAARQDLVREVALLQTDVSGLETEYLSKTQNITESYARSLGYVPPESRVFIPRQSVATIQGAR